MSATSNRGLLVPIVVVVGIVGLFGLTVLRFSFEGDDRAAAIHLDQVEAADDANPTAPHEWSFTPELAVPRARPSADDLRPDYTVRFAIDRWPGWAALVHANGGFKAGKVWKGTFGQNKPRQFLVELIPIDSPAEMREALATGKVQIGSATVDMLPFMLEELQKDPRALPRVLEQLDWSNGGDGIVARGGIASIADLKGKIVVVAEHSPSHFFVFATLVEAGLQPNDVELRFTRTEAEAAAAFARDKAIAACAVRAPNLYKLDGVDGSKLLVSTKSDKGLVADVWFARSDFAAKFLGIMRALGRGVFDGMHELADGAARQKVASQMAERYGTSPGDILRALDDLHWTNYGENREFLLDANNPASFERTYDAATVLLGRGRAVPFDQICDFAIVRSEGFEKYASDQASSPITKGRWSFARHPAPGGEIFVKKAVVYFAPNSTDPHDKSGKGLYDPEINHVLDELAELASQNSGARLVIEGYADVSMQGWVAEERQVELAQGRANAVKAALLARNASLPPTMLVPRGVGARPGDPAQSRRVEITLQPIAATGPSRR